jgi:hypothetical protein
MGKVEKREMRSFFAGGVAGQPIAQQPRVELPEQNLYRDRKAGNRATFG